jgi:hypothetical protein
MQDTIQKTYMAIRSMNKKHAKLSRAVFLSFALVSGQAAATEGALGRPVAGTNVNANAGIVPPEPVWVVNFSQIYLDGTVGHGKESPIVGEVATDINAKISLTMATAMKVWDTGEGRWNFASSFTLPYAWTEVEARFKAGQFNNNEKQQASNLFDIYFSPIIAGYHFSKTEHIALSMNIWAPTGHYDTNSIANTSLNNWTFIPQVAYTNILPEYGLELNAVAGLQFYTRNKDTDYQNAPLLTLDLMALKHWDNGLGAGLVIGTVQQLADDSGPTADALNGFRGRDWAIGPIITYDTKLDSTCSLSLGLRWVPTVSSKNRLDSNNTFMGTATLVF